MQIVRDRNTFVVYYKFDDNEKIELTTSILKTPKYRVLDMNSGTHEIEIVEDTPLFVGGAMKYDNGWLIVNQDRYDEALQRERDKRVVESKDRFKQKLIAPVVDTGLGFSVDGARENKDDFKTKWELMGELDTTTVRDASNVFHEGITKAQIETIWKAIAANGEVLYQWKWAKEAEIQAAGTIEELRAVVI